MCAGIDTLGSMARSLSVPGIVSRVEEEVVNTKMQVLRDYLFPVALLINEVEGMANEGL